MKSSPAVVKVHACCRSSYNLGRPCPQLKRKLSVEADDCTGGPVKMLRSTAETWDWKTDCFLCCKNAVPDVKHFPKSKNDVRVAGTKKLFHSLRTVCDQRQDKWAFDVVGRLDTSGDAVAAEARYHTRCYWYFTNGRTMPSVLKGKLQAAGRCQDTEMIEIFQNICEWMEESIDELYTVVEVQQEMRRRAGNKEAVYGVKHLKRLLIEHYGDSIMFGSVCGRKDVVCFRHMASRIINDKWYSDRKQDPRMESERIMETAAKLLRASVRETDYDNETYRLNSVIRDRALAKQWMPPLLQTFLEHLFTDEVKQIAIGHSIVQACRPRSVMSPVLFGVGVSVDHVLGAQWLVKELCSLGFSVSADEVNRYKQSVVQADGSDLPPHGPNVFLQWAADNVLEGLGGH